MKGPKSSVFKGVLVWQSGTDRGRLLEGAGAIALAADCRFAPFYPMSPAMGILAIMVEHSSGLPIAVEQAEEPLTPSHLYGEWMLGLYQGRGKTAAEARI